MRAVSEFEAPPAKRSTVPRYSGSSPTRTSQGAARTIRGDTVHASADRPSIMEVVTLAESRWKIVRWLAIDPCAGGLWGCWRGVVGCGAWVGCASVGCTWAAAGSTVTPDTSASRPGRAKT